jgi:hypothetical protein
VLKGKPVAIFHRSATLILVVVIGVGGTAACGNDASSPAAATPTRSLTAPSSTRSSTTGDVPPPPEVGQCRNTPAADLRPDVWVDNTPVVDCSKPHTLQTAAVIKPVEELTLAQARQLAASCETPVVDYLGITFPAVRTINDQVVFWPSPAQRAAGQNWLRCDVGVTATTGCCRLAPQTGSLRGAVGRDPVRFQVCIDQIPDPARPQPLTSCQKSHRAEALPTGLALDVTHYPSSAALSEKGHVECAQLVSPRRDHGSLVTTPEWESRDQWSGGTLYGRCWIHRATGLLPPIR